MTTIYSGINPISGGSGTDLSTTLSDYAKKTDVNMTLEEANNKLNEVLGTTDVKYFE